MQQVQSRQYIDALYCPTCQKQFQHNQYVPKSLLVCRHSLCHVCLHNLIYNSQYPACPVCQSLIPVAYRDPDKFPVNAVLIELLHRIMAERDKCQIHKLVRETVCMEDGIRICIKCSEGPEHQGHNIKTAEVVKNLTKNTLKKWENLWTQLDNQYEDLVAIFLSEEKAFKNSVTKTFSSKYDFLESKDKDAKVKAEVCRITMPSIESKVSKVKGWLDKKKSGLHGEVDQVYDPETAKYRAHIKECQKKNL